MMRALFRSRLTDALRRLAAAALMIALAIAPAAYADSRPVALSLAHQMGSDMPCPHDAATKTAPHQQGKAGSARDGCCHAVVVGLPADLASLMTPVARADPASIGAETEPAGRAPAMPDKPPRAFDA